MEFCSDKDPEVGLLGRTVVPALIVGGPCLTFSIAAAPSPPAPHEGPVSLHPRQRLFSRFAFVLVEQPSSWLALVRSPDDK